MSKTNCINCGAAKESSDLQCPFCGTKYVDLTTLDLFYDDKLFIQLRGKSGQIKTAKAYITNRTMQMHPNSVCARDASGQLHQRVTSLNVTGSIDFTLYESL